MVDLRCLEALGPVESLSTRRHTTTPDTTVAPPQQTYKTPMDGMCRVQSTSGLRVTEGHMSHMCVLYTYTVYTYL